MILRDCRRRRRRQLLNDGWRQLGYPRLLGADRSQTDALETEDETTTHSAPTHRPKLAKQGTTWPRFGLSAESRSLPGFGQIRWEGQAQLVYQPFDPVVHAVSVDPALHVFIVLGGPIALRPSCNGPAIPIARLKGVLAYLFPVRASAVPLVDGVYACC